MPMPNPDAFAARLRSLRESRGRSVEDLAAITGLNRQAIYYLEAGKRQPTWATVCRLAGVPTSIVPLARCAVTRCRRRTPIRHDTVR